MAREILCAYGVDVDAVGGWLGSYGGADSPNDISRGMFAGEVGTPRLLELFRRFDFKTTWFIPGHSIETFPEQMRMIVEAGHETGLHGYSHENPIAMSLDQEREVLGHTLELMERLAGRRPRGYVAPWWEIGPNTVQLLLEHGIKYDHSMMHRDFEPYYLRVGDSWTKIDLARPAREWMKPLVRGQETDLIEIPGSWYLDDLPPMMFIKASPNSHGFVNPRDIEQLWRDQFDWVYRECDYAVFALTIHPDVSGRPQALLMHERFISYLLSHPGVRFCTFEEIADDFARRRPRQQARRTADRREPLRTAGLARAARVSRSIDGWRNDSCQRSRRPATRAGAGQALPSVAPGRAEGRPAAPRRRRLAGPSRGPLRRLLSPCQTRPGTR